MDLLFQVALLLRDVLQHLQLRARHPQGGLRQYLAGIAGVPEGVLEAIERSMHNVYEFMS